MVKHVQLQRIYIKTAPVAQPFQLNRPRKSFRALSDGGGFRRCCGLTESEVLLQIVDRVLRAQVVVQVGLRVLDAVLDTGCTADIPAVRHLRVRVERAA